MVANTPTSKRIVQAGTRTHQCATQRNTPGVLPQIVRPITIPPPTTFYVPHIIEEVSTLAKAHKVIQKRAEKCKKGSQINTQQRSTCLTNGKSHIRLQNNCIISQMAMNMLHLDDLNNNPTPFTPTRLLPPPAPPMNLEHHTMPMVHPVTRETISSYKKLMNDHVTAETWQTAFGKDFQRMCQGDKKLRTVGTNAMFVMTPKDVKNMPPKRFATYAKTVVDFCPQKEDPHRIRITTGGNLINHPGELMTRTADITTSKQHWNSVLSTQQAKYMCIDLKFFTFLCRLNITTICASPSDCFQFG
jgi:hypothetical protein